MLSHASLQKIIPIDHLSFAKYGVVGVYLFFVLSAYLLDRQIITRIRSNTATKHYWIYYCERRFLRIYPLYFVAVFACFGLTSIGVKTKVTSISEVWNHLILIDAQGVFWSIPVEIKYYILSPIILLFCWRFFNFNKKLTMFLLLLLSAASMYLGVFGDYSIDSIVNLLPFFLAGTVVSVILIDQNQVRVLSTRTITILGLLSLGIIAMCLPHKFMSYYSTTFNHALLSFYGVVWAVVLVSSLKPNTIVHWITTQRIFRFTGIISYSLYLWHMPVILVAKYYMPDINLWLMLAIYFIGSYFVAYISYIFIERTFLAFRRNSVDV